MNKKGISLAEMLVVVVVMGIITGIAIPLVGNIIDTAKKKAFISDIYAITEANRIYRIANGNTTNELKVNDELKLYLSKDFSNYEQASIKFEGKNDLSSVNLKDGLYETRLVYESRDGKSLIYKQARVPVNANIDKYVVKNKN